VPINSYGHYGIPDFYNCKQELHWDGEDWQLYIDLDNKDKIQSIYFMGPRTSKNIDLFEEFSLKFEKKSASEALKSEGPFPPWFMFRLAYREFRGLNQYHYQVVNQRSDELLCRCFGVYRSQIEKYVVENKGADLRSLSDEFLVGSACGSCLEMAKTFLPKAEASSEKTTPTKKTQSLTSLKLSWPHRINGQSPADYLIKIDQQIQSYLKETGETCEVKIKGMNQDEVWVEIRPEEKGVVLKQALLEVLSIDESFTFDLLLL
jgi:NifU-like protein